MSQTIYMILGDGGDGSNFTVIVKDHDVLKKLHDLADDGDGTWASGDGLQAKKLTFPDEFDLDDWVQTNFYGYYTLEDI